MSKVVMETATAVSSAASLKNVQSSMDSVLQTVQNARNIIAGQEMLNSFSQATIVEIGSSIKSLKKQGTAIGQYASLIEQSIEAIEVADGKMSSTVRSGFWTWKNGDWTTISGSYEELPNGELPAGASGYYSGLSASGLESCLSLDEKFEKLIAKGGEWINKQNGYNTDSETYIDWVKKTIEELVDPVGAINSGIDFYESLGNGVCDKDTYDNFWDLMKDIPMPTPVSPYIKAVATVMKTYPKYAAMGDEIQAQVDDWSDIPGALGQELVLFGKAVTDCTAQVIDSTFKLTYIGDTLHIITGHDVPADCAKVSSAINNFVDNIFGI